MTYLLAAARPMKPKTIGSKLFIIVATALAITTVCSAEAKHDHGGGGC